MTPTTVAFAPSARARLAQAVTAALVAFASGGAHAAFFQLAENSPAGLGNAFAGGAAIAEDASTVWYNPAGLTRLQDTQMVLGGHYIKPSLKFDKTSATTVFGTPISGGEGGDAGDAAILPNFYLSHSYNDRVNVGIGVNVPFGLVSDYNDDWVGRYYAIRSEIETININPAIGYKISETFSVGGGINYQRMDAELSQAIDYGTACVGAEARGQVPPNTCTALSLQPGQDDGKATVTADDSAWGYNLGFLWTAPGDSRVGLHYRSKLEYQLDGKVDVRTPANAAPFATPAGIVDSGAKADVTLPATLSLSAFSQLNAQWAIMADVTRTYWSDLPKLLIEFASAQPDSLVTLGLQDVNRYSAGATFTPGGPWAYRLGVAIDKTPTPNASVRTPRLPDEDRSWLSFGVGYKSSDRLTFDLAYTYVKVDTAEINKTATASNENSARGNLVGDYNADIQILSGQVNWKF